MLSFGGITLLKRLPGPSGNTLPSQKLQCRGDRHTCRKDNFSLQGTLSIPSRKVSLPVLKPESDLLVLGAGGYPQNNNPAYVPEWDPWGNYRGGGYQGNARPPWRINRKETEGLFKVDGKIGQYKPWETE